MKKRLLATLAIVLGLSLSTGGTIAYFTAEDTAHNVITSGNIDIALMEWADEEKTVLFPEEEIHGIMPGTRLTKIAEVKNTGAKSAYIRAGIEKSIVLQDSAKGIADASLIGLELNKEYWQEKEDGFFYYKNALEAGAVTEPLFMAITFDSGMTNEYQNSKASVKVTAYAVQKDNNADDAFHASGWPEE